MNHAVRVLLVEDDEDYYLLTKLALRDLPGGPHELDWCSGYEAAGEAIARRQHDLYFVDYRLGDGDGLALIERARGSGNDAVMILFTGFEGDEIAGRAQEAGANGYLVKGKVNARRLEGIVAAARRNRARVDG
jgi:DNA-binding NtrC family response regulator